MILSIIDEWQNRSDCNESLVSLADLRICDVADLLSGYSNSRNNGDRLDQWHIVWYMVTRTCWQIVSWMASSGMDAGADLERHHRRRGSSVRISTAIDYIVFMLELSGRLRIYGEDRFCHGSTFQEIRSFRKILHSYADCYRMWSARRHGQSHDWKRARSSFDDHGHNLHALFCKVADYCLSSRGLFPHQSWVAPSAYFLGMTAIIFSGISRKNTFVCWRYSSFYHGIARISFSSMVSGPKTNLWPQQVFC